MIVSKDFKTIIFKVGNEEYDQIGSRNNARETFNCKGKMEDYIKNG